MQVSAILCWPASLAPAMAQKAAKRVAKVLAARLRIIPETAETLAKAAPPWPGPLRTRFQSLSPSCSTSWAIIGPVSSAASLPFFDLVRDLFGLLLNGGSFLYALPLIH